MPKKLMVVLANTDPSNPSELGAPLSQASVAAAMGYEVEVIFTGRSGELAKKGVSAGIQVPGSDKTAYAFIQDGYEAGVLFKVCSPALSIWGDDLIPEIGEVIGSAYVISEAMEGETVTFTY